MDQVRDGRRVSVHHRPSVTDNHRLKTIVYRRTEAMWVVPVMSRPRWTVHVTPTKPSHAPVAHVHIWSWTKVTWTIIMAAWNARYRWRWVHHSKWWWTIGSSAISAGVKITLHTNNIHTPVTHRLTQPCIPPGSLNRAPALIGWGKGRNVSSAGWQVTLCVPVWHVSSHSGKACL